ncbi:MAG: AAA family ATPase [Deltaproteobacteria bacterium]
MKLVTDAYLRSIVLLRERVESFARFPFAVPAVRHLETLELHPQVTFLVGENGSGKSTLIEAVAMAAGFNAEGGSENFHFATRPSESELHAVLRLVRGTRRPKTGYFMRAESFFNVATQVEELKVGGGYGGKPLHEQSHGESFLALVNNRFGPHGLYLLDEPEAALSPQRQLAFLRAIDGLVRKGKGDSQMIIATHSPILLAYPNAWIYLLDEKGITKVSLEETEHYSLTKDFLNHRDRYLRRLLEDDD